MNRASNQRTTSRLKRGGLLLAWSLGLFIPAGCPSTEVHRTLGDAGKSPNAGMRPSPRTSATSAVSREIEHDEPVGTPADSRGRNASRDASVPTPVPLAPASPLEPERLNHRELPGVHLSASWSWENTPSPPSNPDVNHAGIKAARVATHVSWQVELLEAGRLRVVFDSPCSDSTTASELRSRVDVVGHVLVWPNADSYRVIPPGALRALLDEQRVDVSPMTEGLVGKGQNDRPFNGFPTRSVPVSTPWGTVEIVQARITNAGAGGALLCRLLLEIVGAQPNSSVCEDGKLPVRAAFQWLGGGKLAFEVTALVLRPDFPTSLFLVPPTRATFVSSGLPPNCASTNLTFDQLRAFRTRASDLPVPRTDPEALDAPQEGIIATNRTDSPRILLLDGVPVAWIPAQSEQHVRGPRDGRYRAQWRSFLGTAVDEPFDLWIPSRISVGIAPEETGD